MLKEGPNFRGGSENGVSEREPCHWEKGGLCDEFGSQVSSGGGNFSRESPRCTLRERKALMNGEHPEGKRL